MNTNVRPFDKVKDIINKTGLDISYYYDDLIFSDHSLFIIQFHDKDPEILKLFFNKDCEFDKKIKFKDILCKESEKLGFLMLDEGTFYITENPENREISIHYE